MPVTLIIALTFLFGLVFGSFLNVCISWIPLGESFVWPPSHCPSCKTCLRALDFLPLLNWLMLKGKCRYCEAAIHWRYPAVELINAVGWVFVIARCGLTVEGVAGVFLFSLSLAIAAIDLEHYIIPNGLVVLLLVSGIIYRVLVPEITVLNCLLGLVTGFAIPLLLAVLSRGGMGGGDIKLMAAIGWWVGFPAILYVLFWGALSGSLVGILLLLLQKKKRKDPIPFGPFLVLGFLIVFLEGRL